MYLGQTQPDWSPLDFESGCVKQERLLYLLIVPPLLLSSVISFSLVAILSVNAWDCLESE